ncbi:PREDICTED: cathepsin L1-like [Rhagoletis zephyria]|uniref:cathepsin L1-like n=1 Tax=Rhagoletis zephyria TaxID=28612 RepID=UPI0008119634|nr:PREDICTED: cathepsin L1-like [Rhagoletis zephyria]
MGIDGNAKVASLVPGFDRLSPAEMFRCYNSSIGKENFNIFDNQFWGAIEAYYRNFPENFDLQKLPEKTANLFKTMQRIAQYTLACVGLSSDNFQLGLTQFSDWSLNSYKKLSGARASPASIRARLANKPKYKDDDDDEAPSETTRPKNNGLRLIRRKRDDEAPIDPICIPKNKSPLPDEFDWRKQGKVTPVKWQKECGSCWTFASISALESAYLIKGKTTDANFDLSEQQLLSCGVDRGCESGGTAVDAYTYILTNKGVTGESTLPYDHKNVKCEKKKRSAKIKDFCVRGIYVSIDGKPEELNDMEIQYAVREYGPVYTTIDGEGSDTLQHYKNGVYDEPKCKKETNHAVVIVGWTKDSWIVKNSWGEKWGIDGYVLMKRGKNMCGINSYISWPMV